VEEQQRYHHLFKKLLDNDCPPEAVPGLLDWLSDPANENASGEWIMSELDVPAVQDLDENTRSRLEMRLQAILNDRKSVAGKHKVIRLISPWKAIAAGIALLLGVAAFIVWKQNQPLHTSQYVVSDIAPGKNGAILTLGNNRQIVLDSLGDQDITTAMGTVAHVQAGQLYYRGTAKGSRQNEYNTLKTPNGRQYSIRLPDGTRAWLNAASSLSFPTNFSGKERQVKISGEVFFEVAKDERLPFKVVLPGGESIEVLGTSFNINAYQDNGLTTATLITGAIRVNAPYAGSVRLEPGQQASLSGNNTSIPVTPNIDIARVTAWKEGLFNFNGLGLKEAMNQLARWYDIEIIYPQGIPKIEFFGEIARDASLTSVLKGLEGAGVHFKLEAGNKLYVYP